MFARSILFVCATAIFLSAAVGESQAQTREDWRATEEGAQEKKLVIQQSYTGVTPGSTAAYQLHVESVDQYTLPYLVVGTG